MCSLFCYDHFTTRLCRKFLSTSASYIPGTNVLCRDYTTKVFGFATFGRVYGAIICLSGIANFSQYGLDALTHRTFDGNPIPINAALAIAGFIVGMALVIFVFVSVRKLHEQGQADDEERERLLLEEDEYEDEYQDEGNYR